MAIVLVGDKPMEGHAVGFSAGCDAEFPRCRYNFGPAFVDVSV